MGNYPISLNQTPVNPDSALLQCACPSHYTWDILNINLGVPAKKVFREVFGEKVNKWSNVHKRCGTNGLFMADWIPEETGNSWKRNLVYSPLINLPNGLYLFSIRHNLTLRPFLKVRASQLDCYLLYGEANSQETPPVENVRYRC